MSTEQKYKANKIMSIKDIAELEMVSKSTAQKRIKLYRYMAKDIYKSDFFRYKHYCLICA